MTKTPPKQLDVLNWNFQDIFLEVSSCESDKNLMGRANMLRYHRRFYMLTLLKTIDCVICEKLYASNQIIVIKHHFI